MSIPGAASPLFLATTAGAAGDFEISRSLRFNSGDSAYLNRTPSSAGNQNTWTWSGWIKRSKLQVENQSFFGSENGSNREAFLAFNSDDTLRFSDTGTGSSSYILNLSTTQVFRDPSAWYHIVAAWDSNNATQADRARLYVNGVRVTSFSTNTNSVSSSADSYVNGANQHFISRYVNYSNSATHSDGYLAEVNFIDGSALDPTSFGAFDDNGVWQAIDTAGLTFGTNGFRLQFADNSSNAALGTDSSGNSNTWTINNLSIGGRDYLAEGTVSGTFYTSVGGGVDKMFDGSPSSGSFSQSGTASFTFGGAAVVGSTSIKIRGFKGDASGANVLVNGTDISSLLNAQSGGGYSTVNVTSTLGGAPVTLASVAMVNAGGGSGNIAQIIVDDVVLTIGSPAGNDSLVDTPTNGTQTDTGLGSEVVGNYATLNPLESALTGLNNGNLNSGASGANSWKIVTSTIGVSSGKYYWEGFTDTTATESAGWQWGVCNVSPASLTTPYGAGKWSYQHGSIYNQTTSATTVGTTAGANDLLGYALDMDAGTLKLYVNNSLVHTFTGLTGTVTPFVGSYNTPTMTVNFGQRAFAYTAPSGYKALNTANLPTPTIADGSLYFDTKLYTGNGSTQSITGYNFSPDFVWLKSRNQSYNHYLLDQIRGAGKVLQSNNTDAEVNQSDTLTSFNSDGFSLDSRTGVNSNNNTFVGWAWDAGTSTVSNTDGSITSQVRANPTAGFSIVSWTGTSANATVGHGLNAAPEFIITKVRGMTSNWNCYHTGLTDATKYVWLNSTSAEATQTAAWNSTDPTSSVIHVGGEPELNRNGYNTIAFCFAPVEGYSAMGSYEGNGNADGPFIHTGFKPGWIMIKNIDNYGTGYDWFIFDSKRDTYNTSDAILKANLSDAESDSDSVDILSNGFKLRATTNGINLNAHTHVYIAFASNPFASNGGLAR